MAPVWQTASMMEAPPRPNALRASWSGGSLPSRSPQSLATAMPTTLGNCLTQSPRPVMSSVSNCLIKPPRIAMPSPPMSALGSGGSARAPSRASQVLTPSSALLKALSPSLMPLLARPSSAVRLAQCQGSFTSSPGIEAMIPAATKGHPSAGSVVSVGGSLATTAGGSMRSSTTPPAIVPAYSLAAVEAITRDALTPEVLASPTPPFSVTPPVSCRPAEVGEKATAEKTTSSTKHGQAPVATTTESSEIQSGGQKPSAAETAAERPTEVSSSPERSIQKDEPDPVLAADLVTPSPCEEADYQSAPPAPVAQKIKCNARAKVIGSPFDRPRMSVQKRLDGTASSPSSPSHRVPSSPPQRSARAETPSTCAPGIKEKCGHSQWSPRRVGTEARRGSQTRQPRSARRSTTSPRQGSQKSQQSSKAADLKAAALKAEPLKAVPLKADALRAMLRGPGFDRVGGRRQALPKRPPSQDVAFGRDQSSASSASPTVKDVDVAAASQPQLPTSSPLDSSLSEVSEEFQGACVSRESLATTLSSMEACVRSLSERSLRSSQTAQPAMARGVKSRSMPNGIGVHSASSTKAHPKSAGTVSPRKCKPVVHVEVAMEPSSTVLPAPSEDRPVLIRSVLPTPMPPQNRVDLVRTHSRDDSSSCASECTDRSTELLVASVDSTIGKKEKPKRWLSAVLVGKINAKRDASPLASPELTTSGDGESNSSDELRQAQEIHQLLESDRCVVVLTPSPSGENLLLAAANAESTALGRREQEAAVPDADPISLSRRRQEAGLSTELEKLQLTGIEAVIAMTAAARK